MRKLEFLLLFSQVLWTIIVLFIPNRKKIRMVSIGVLLLLVAHLVIEGYRWQMLLAYVLSSIMIYSAIKRGSFVKKIVDSSNGKKYTIILSVSILLLCNSALLILVPVFKLPNPTGAYAIGIKSEYWVDKSINERSTSHRELMVTMWYPADIEVTSREHVVRYPFKEIGGALESLYGIPASLFNYMSYIKTNSYSQAMVSNKEEKYPVIVFSHGFNATRMQNFSQMEELASHGYIVISVDHPLDAAYIKYPDGTFITNQISPFDFIHGDHQQNVLERSKDASFIINMLDYFYTSSDHFLFGKVDLEHVGIIGHSYGGATAVKTLFHDNRFIAGVNMDGGLYGIDVHAGVDKPLMTMLALSSYNYEPSENELQMMGLSSEAYRRMMDNHLDDVQTLYKSSKNSKSYMLTFLVGDHMSFTDSPLISPLLSVGYNPHTMQREINGYVLDFFNQHLKGIDSDNLVERQTDKYQLQVYN